MTGELVSVRLLEFVIPKDWFTVAIDAVRSVSRFLAAAAALAVKPGNAVPSSPAIGLFPAPKGANGGNPGSPNPLDIVFRNSKPPLKACLPWVQLRSSPMEYIGLSWLRQAPKRPYWTNGVQSEGTT